MSWYSKIPNIFFVLATRLNYLFSRLLQVVDDDKFIRDTLTSMLKKMSEYTVTVVDSGPKALDLLAQPSVHVDLILADVCICLSIRLENPPPLRAPTINHRD